jgi:hypothetical protein
MSRLFPTIAGVALVASVACGGPQATVSKVGPLDEVAAVSQPTGPPQPATTVAPAPVAPRPTVPQPAPVPAVPGPTPVTTTVLDLEPAVVTASLAVAQRYVNAGKIAETIPPTDHIPVLNGDIVAGFGYWSFLPMGTLFESGGHTYRVFHRVALSIAGGNVPQAYVGGDLDLHTCLKGGGSTLTWANLVD